MITLDVIYKSLGKKCIDITMDEIDIIEYFLKSFRQIILKEETSSRLMEFSFKSAICTHFKKGVL